MQIQIEGRRAYVLGDTFAIKDKIKSMGGHWDADRRAWWLAANQKDKLDAIIGARQAVTQQQAQAGMTDRDMIAGKAEYKGKTYLLLWEGTTSRGTQAAKLAFRDGSKTFWADAAEYRVSKRYREPISLQRLNKLAAEYKSGERQDHTDQVRCIHCGEWTLEGDDWCMACGRAGYER